MDSSERWNQIFKEGRDFTPLNTILLDSVLNKINSSRNEGAKMALDIGCGTGDTLTKLAARGFVAQGIDWSEVALEKAKRRLEEAGLSKKVSLLRQDLQNINTNALQKPIDVILCKLVLAFIQNKASFIEKISQILNQEGAFVLITPVLHKNISYIPDDKPGIAVDFEETHNSLLEHFSRVEIFHHNYFGERGDEVTFICSKK